MSHLGLEPLPGVRVAGSLKLRLTCVQESCPIRHILGAGGFRCFIELDCCFTWRQFVIILLSNQSCTMNNEQKRHFIHEIKKYYTGTETGKEGIHIHHIIHYLISSSITT